MAEPLKAKAMIDYLREQIAGGRLLPGTRLPVLRELMAKFGISFGTAKRGIDYLCMIGLVEIRAQSGIYVKAGSPLQESGKRKIAVFMHYGMEDTLRGIYPTVFLGIQKEAESAGYALELHFVGIDRITPETLNDVGRQVDGVILLAEYDAILKELNAMVPVVGVCLQNSFGGTVSLLDIDHYQAAELAVDYFRQRGVGKVMAVVDKSHFPVYAARAAQFINAWRETGGQGEIGTTPENFAADCGYWFATGSLLQSAAERYRAIHAVGLADQYFVLGVDGKHLLVPDFESVPALAADWQTIGRYAFRECAFRIDNPGSIPRRIMTPVRLTE